MLKKVKIKDETMKKEFWLNATIEIYKTRDVELEEEDVCISIEHPMQRYFDDNISIEISLPELKDLVKKAEQLYSLKRSSNS